MLLGLAEADVIQNGAAIGMSAKVNREAVTFAEKMEKMRIIF